MTNDFKLRGKCAGCKQTKWFLRKHTMTIPGTGIEVKGRDLVCKPCANKLSGITH